MIFIVEKRNRYRSEWLPLVTLNYNKQRKYSAPRHATPPAGHKLQLRYNYCVL